MMHLVYLIVMQHLWLALLITSPMGAGFLLQKKEIDALKLQL